ncbi:MAG: transcription elongation factor TFIIS [Hyperionvirus sp.]|uniref:Transcription elongation factor TFIIS n=1 Tax=Hyperionvirus sp. TaxID=2487770 RepID=A0A3G5ACC9_9VIRU|nr:MAG: transcription elongation factor TFIIS [Hyperionvirus sp.]
MDMNMVGYSVTSAYMRKVDIENFDAGKLSLHKANFITENSKDIEVGAIVFGGMNIARALYVLRLNKLLGDIRMAIGIEMGIYEYSLIHAALKNIEKDFIPAIYDDKFVDIYMNLDGESRLKNKTLGPMVFQGGINLKLIAFLSPPQIHPESWTPILNKIKYKETTEKNMATTDRYKCHKCGESKAQVTELQLRSADEPCTTFITCLVCYNTDLK